jgi:hypothetical protein
MASPNIVVVGPDAFVGEPAWIIEDVEQDLSDAGLHPFVVDRHDPGFDLVETEDRFKKGEVGALVVVNYDPVFEERFALDTCMNALTGFAFGSGAPIFVTRPIDKKPFSELGRTDVIVCRPGKLVALIKNRLGEKN